MILIQDFVRTAEIRYNNLLDKIKILHYTIFQLYMLSRVDERIGFMTPQQPISLGANTDKANALNDDE